MLYNNWNNNIVSKTIFKIKIPQSNLNEMKLIEWSIPLSVITLFSLSIIFVDIASFYEKYILPDIKFVIIKNNRLLKKK